MTVPRLDNGVRVRADGKGDAWANMHRVGLGNTAYMSDIDAMIGLLGWGSNMAEKLFLEVVPDDFENRHYEIRNFAVIALFDRKRSLEYAVSESNQFTRQVYTWLCRTIGQTQPEAPKFFYVIGTDKPPWTMYEVDVHNPEVYAPRGTIATSSDFETMWRAVGLMEKRSKLVDWVRRGITT